MVIFLLFFLTSLFGDDPKIDFWFEQAQVQEEVPIDATFIITHDAGDRIDTTSFLFDQKQIEATLLTKKTAGNLVIETFRFTLPPLKPGSYRFQGLSAKVGNYEVMAPPSSLTVTTLDHETPAKNGSTAFLEITPYMVMPEKLYPGMQITLGYRYRFRGALLLKQEILPLIDQNPFEKEGDKIIEEGHDKEFSIRTVYQKFRVRSPGDYLIPESSISGYSYVERAGGQKILQEPRLFSKIPPFTITVSPFPDKGKPPFFNGILGPFSAMATLLSKRDPIKFQITFSGSGDPHTLAAPDLRCMPGFNMLFTFDESGPLRDKESFIYELKPLLSGSFSIPSIPIATFDPSTESYSVMETEPIPIQLIAPRINETPLVPTLATMISTPFTPPVPWKGDDLDPLTQRAHLFYEHGYLPEALFLLRQTHSPMATELENYLRVPPKQPPTLSPYLIVASLALLLLLIAAYKKRKGLALFSALLTLLFIALFYFSRPIDAQLITPTFLYKSPHLSSPKSKDTLLLSGTEVEVIDVIDQGKWLKVKTPDDSIGFIPFEAAAIYPSKMYTH